jgi:3-oxoadipate enol-lactonase
MTSVRNGDATIAFEASGVRGGPVVLLAHSLGATREMWRPQIAALERDFQVVRYDARGHGQSSVPGGDYTLSQLGSDALAVMDACAAPRAHVCGISMGGQVAMWLAINAPERVDQVVLANTAARIGTPQTWAERIETVRTQGLAAIASTVRGRWLTPAFADRHQEITEALASGLVNTDPAGSLGCCAALRDADLTAALPRIESPALVIAGDHDPSTTVADAELLCDRIRNARLTRLPTAHISNLEAAAQFTAAIAGFFREATHE